MNVDVFTLCEFARVESGDRMTIVGTFNSIRAREAPVVHPFCALAVIMRFQKIEEGTKKVRVSLIDLDGRPIIPTLDAQLNVRVNPDDSDTSLPLVLVIQQITLPRFGEYWFDLAVDGRREATIPLYVRQVQSPQQMLPQSPLQA